MPEHVFDPDLWSLVGGSTENYLTYYRPPTAPASALKQDSAPVFRTDGFVEVVFVRGDAPLEETIAPQEVKKSARQRMIERLEGNGFDFN